jgi:hypothetical protein
MDIAGGPSLDPKRTCAEPNFRNAGDLQARRLMLPFGLGKGGANPPSERFGTSPVVYDGDLRFMGDNLVVSFARPGGNTTGGTTHADAQSGGEEVKRASWGTYALIV